MTIIKNEIPILEYDTDKNSVIMPDHEHLNMILPRKAVFGFLGNYINRFAEEKGGKTAGYFISITKKYPAYIINYKGNDVCLIQAPAGSASAVQVLDWLYAYGAEEVIATGSCGTLEDIEENRFLVPKSALRDEGTSYHYMAPSRYAHINEKALKAIEKTLKEHDLAYEEVTTWTTDGFYRETEAKTEYRRKEGCSVVDMECSALVSCAEMRGKIFGEIFFTADTLANLEQHDERNWGTDSYGYALELALDSVINI